MTFEYPTGHVLSTGGYKPPSTRRVSGPMPIVEPPERFTPGLFTGYAPETGPGGTMVDPSTGLPGQVQEASMLGLLPGQIGGLTKMWPWLAGAGAGATVAGMLGGNGAEPGTEVGTGARYGEPFGGPGLKEPGGKYLLKEWHIRMDSKEGDFDLQFYLTMNDRGTKRVFMYNQRTKAWKTWPMPRLAVIGKNLPSHQMLTRLRRNLKRHTADAVTILKLTSPGKLESTRRPGGKWVRSRKRRYID